MGVSQQKKPETATSDATSQASGTGAQASPDAEREAYRNLRDSLATGEERYLLNELSRIDGSNYLARAALKMEEAAGSLEMAGKGEFTHLARAARYYADHAGEIARFAEDTLWMSGSPGLSDLYEGLDDQARSVVWQIDEVVQATIADLHLPYNLSPVPAPHPASFTGENWLWGLQDYVVTTEERLTEVYELGHAAWHWGKANQTQATDGWGGHMQVATCPVFAAPGGYQDYLWMMVRYGMGRHTLPGWLEEAAGDSGTAISDRRAAEASGDSSSGGTSWSGASSSAGNGW